MVVWHKTKKFKTLQDKWYKKLEKTGFEDAEQDEVYLKQFSGKTGIMEGSELRGTTELGETYKYNYYRNCREFLDTYKFKNKTEHKMFEMHTEGLGVRVIADKLKTYRRKVHETIQGLVKVMRGKA